MGRVLVAYGDDGRLSAGTWVGATGLELASDAGSMPGGLPQEVEIAHLRRELNQRAAELDAARRRVTYLADRDALTGLLNHRAVLLRLEACLNGAPNQRVAALLLDVDDFRRLNETYGRATGDQVLCHVAGALETLCAAGASLGRCGADEFVAVLPGVGVRQATALAHQVQNHLVAHPYHSPDGIPLPVHVSFGTAGSDHVGRSADLLVAAAEVALHESRGSQGCPDLGRLAGGSGRDVELASAVGVLQGLVRAIDNKDRYTKQHAEQVAAFARMLGERLELQVDTLRALHAAGLLHDVGKIGVPDAILRKPGKLTVAEYEVMKGHVRMSSLIVQGLPDAPDLRDAIAAHHERWDGAGYPAGLRGEHIPLVGRIMAIADSFSAMTLDRPYRAGFTVEAALAEIDRCSGTQFDPGLARAFVEMLRACPPRTSAG